MLDSESDAESIPKANLSMPVGCRAVAVPAVGAGRGWGLAFLPRGAQKSEIYDGVGVGTIPCRELLIS